MPRRNRGRRGTGVDRCWLAARPLVSGILAIRFFRCRFATEFPRVRLLLLVCGLSLSCSDTPVIALSGAVHICGLRPPIYNITRLFQHVPGHFRLAVHEFAEMVDQHLFDVIDQGFGCFGKHFGVTENLSDCR